jgi:hypothetical protein
MTWRGRQPALAVATVNSIRPAYSRASGDASLYGAFFGKEFQGGGRLTPRQARAATAANHAPLASPWARRTRAPRKASSAVFASLAEFDLSFLRDVPRARRRSFRQRDLSRAIRAAKAAGITVREITADGRLILETGATAITKPAGAQSWDVAIDQASLKIHPRLS